MKEVSRIISDSTINIEHHSIKPWREVYRKFPKQRKFRPLPSFAALIKRIHHGNDSKIPFISPAVCITNIIALRHLIPCGLFDSSTINGKILLSPAKGVEIFHPFGVSVEIRPQPGEIVLVDCSAKTVICGCFNSRGGRHHMVTPTSCNIVIDIDFHPDVDSANNIENIADEVTQLMKSYCSANVKHYLLDAKSVSINFC